MSEITQDELQLAEDQKKAFDEIVDFLYADPPGEEEEGDYVTLKGHAGTGKSFLVTEIVRYITRKGAQVAMTAPTNKAVKVLRDFDTAANPSVTFATIHSILDLKEHIDGDTGELSFKTDPYNSEPSIDEFGVVIIDESSMLDDELLEELRPWMKKVKFVMVGDPAQIPPVNKEDSEPMRRTDNEVRLSEIKRQAWDNPIIQIGETFRREMDNDFPVIPEEGIGVLHKKDKDRLTGLIDELFACDKFAEDPDHAKVIAWTNNSVGKMNRMIRERIYDRKDLLKLEVGEKLIAHKPIFDQNEQGEEEMIFPTNFEFIVESYSAGMVTIAEEEIGYYDTKVSYEVWDAASQSSQKITKKIQVVDEESEGKFSKVLKMLADRAKKQAPGPDRKKAWKQFYTVKKAFAEIAYNYAITCHKAQGSTYENVLLKENDIDRNKKVRERNRIKYTAVTRASQNLYVVKF